MTAKPSIKFNIFFNYASQFYSILMALIVLPLFLKILGSQAFGLIGFFLLLQSLIRLLDIGISSTLERETARINRSEGAQLQLRSLETCFAILTVPVIALLLLAHSWIAVHWLGDNQLPHQLLENCLLLIFLTLGLRTFSSFYLGGINGFEQQVWSGKLSMLFTSFRLPGALFYLYLSEASIYHYFIYQLIIAFLELFFCARKFYQLLPDSPRRQSLFDLETIKRLAPFALTVAASLLIWLFSSQFDKLLLSRQLSLSDYGYFTLIMTLAEGIMLLSWPVSKALLPRLVALITEKEQHKMSALYCQATRLVMGLTWPIVSLMTFFPFPLLNAWTGNSAAATWGQSVLPLYALAAGFVAISAFSYYLQFAYGKLALHAKFGFYTLLPVVIVTFWAASTYNAVGTGAVRLIISILTCSFWLAYIHHRFAPGIHLRWISTDVIPSLIISLLCMYLTAQLMPDSWLNGRWETLILLSSCTLITMVICLYLSFRHELKAFFHEKK